MGCNPRASLSRLAMRPAPVCRRGMPRMSALRAAFALGLSAWTLAGKCARGYSVHRLQGGAIMDAPV